MLRFDTLRREESVGASALPAPSGIEFDDVDTPGGAIGKPLAFQSNVRNAACRRTRRTRPSSAVPTHPAISASSVKDTPPAQVSMHRN
ncbi:hypothetical protein [Burkholderia vietnamiensis]|uniref:hypothetical protein n=1 Tax=Burkholderia vietnamiensis TaxID=60552 RepID=UPI001593662A|nr:hypothetical protein [Burkholderia vietnamiensis]MCA7943980.1 hypothetical protein [Burkholderia vietnamiensis]HDR8973715.1 hypothetical protein [Burkholderia vietnamiensis]HDR9142637.1 hypothetical protein [Burkholderia vietnamiensis]HDR9220136.1 hypothetical protein [Burkholderia vietnamiensis]